MSTTAPAAEWHLAEKAQAILAGLTAGDVRSAHPTGVRSAAYDGVPHELEPVTGAGRAAFTKLDAMRSAAINAAVGITFEQAFGEFDEALAGLWLDTSAAVPTVSQVVQQALDARLTARAAA